MARSPTSQLALSLLLPKATLIEEVQTEDLTRCLAVEKVAKVATEMEMAIPTMDLTAKLAHASSTSKSEA